MNHIKKLGSKLKFISSIVYKKLLLFYHFVIVLLSAIVYRFPSHKLTVVGITGTKGKSTVVELVHSIFSINECRVASTSSLRFKIGKEEIPNDFKMTMPGRFFLQRFLRKAVRAGCQYAVLEVTSEGIKQFRHRFIDFNAALLTNIHPEHIESHGSFENYLRAKLDLFWRMPKHGIVVLPKESKYAQRFRAATPAKITWYSDKEIKLFNGKVLPVKDIFVGEDKTSLTIGGARIESSLIGKANALDIIAAVALGLSLNRTLDEVLTAIKEVKVVPGRMEFLQREPFFVLLDYAHTPDSLRELYLFAENFVLKRKEKLSEKNNRKMICVFGSAGGGRDKWKRKELGKVANEFCDIVVLTNEDPYDEDPEDIISQIQLGIHLGDGGTKLYKIVDRRKAIRRALEIAQTGDIVVVSGKGSEPWIMGPRGTKIPWSEKKVIEEELAKLK